MWACSKNRSPLRDLERDVPAGQLHLQFHGVVVGAVKDGDLVQGHALVAQLEYPLGDEFRLLDARP